MHKECNKSVVTQLTRAHIGYIGSVVHLPSRPAALRPSPPLSQYIPCGTRACVTTITYYAEKCSALPKRLTNSSLLKYSYTSTGENLTITFWCEEGYQLIGPYIFACNSTYRWSLDLEVLKCLGQGKYYTLQVSHCMYTILIHATLFYTTANSGVLILGSAGGIVVAIIVVILLIVLLKMCSENFKTKKSKNLLPTA